MRRFFIVPVSRGHPGLDVAEGRLSAAPRPDSGLLDDALYELSYRFDNSVFAVKASLNPTALFLVSFLALIVNIAVFVYHFAKVFKYKRNIAVGVHSDLAEYQELAAERTVSPSSPLLRWAA